MTSISRFWIAGIILLLLSVGISINAYRKKGQFYPACIYILRSNASYIPIVCTFFYGCIVIAMGLKYIFFGPLRIIEHEHIYENAWYSASEILMAMTIFKDEFNTRFAIFFGLLMLGKLAHGLLRDRLDYMEQAAFINRIFHIRMICLFFLLLTLDLGFLKYSISHISFYGPSMMLIFAFETGVLSVCLFSSIVKYGFNVYDASLSPDEWEAKSVATLYLEVVSGFVGLADFFRLVIYGTFFTAVTSLYGLPIHIIRDLYVTVKSLATRIQDLRRFLQVTQNMDERYPNATEDELEASDRLCIVCREDMQAAKKLNCGHMFHFKCLKSWLERQQTCPTCRSPIIPQTQIPSSPLPTPSPIRSSPILSSSYEENQRQNTPYYSNETDLFHKVERKIEKLRKIQHQINEIIAEFDQLKAESD